MPKKLGVLEHGRIGSFAKRGLFGFANVPNVRKQTFSKMRIGGFPPFCHSLLPDVGQVVSGRSVSQSCLVGNYVLFCPPCLSFFWPEAQRESVQKPVFIRKDSQVFSFQTFLLAYRLQFFLTNFFLQKKNGLKSLKISLIGTKSQCKYFFLKHL